MRKIIKTLFSGILIAMPLFTNAAVPVTNGTFVGIDLVYSVFDRPTNKGPKRNPPQCPIVYLDSSSSTILFDTPCYGYEIELIDLDTEMTVYTCFVPDGDNTVQLPSYLSGEYEIHIHRNMYCFCGFIFL